MRLVSPAELVSAKQIAELVGVVESAVANWRNRPATRFPAPWGEWPGVRLWVLDEVEEWHDARLAAAEARRLELVARHRRALERLEASH